MTKDIDENLPAIIGATLADFLNSLHFGAAGVGGTFIGLAISKLLKSRLDASRKIFVEEIQQSKRPIKDVHEADEFVAIIYKYLDAAAQGAARLNLRLLAKVVRGQFEGEGLYADEFLRYANILADLQREEVIFLATLYRHFSNRVGDNVTTFKNVCEELVPNVYPTLKDVEASAAALQRTGLIAPLNISILGGSGFLCEPSPRLAKILHLASFEAALDEERP